MEAGCSKMHKEAVVSAELGDTIRTLVISGRPLRVKRNEYIDGWEARQEDIKRLTGEGVVPFQKDLDEDREDVDFPFLMGMVAGMVNDVKPARDIVEDMVAEAVKMIKLEHGYLNAAVRENKL